MYTIDNEECLGCGICTGACDNKAITIDEDEAVAVIDREKCVECGSCVEVCSAGAIKDA